MIITRFAPSPTGVLHIGSIRIALYSWLFAKNNNGKFLLRIEDTDNTRSKNFFIDKIINDMKWLNINWDNKVFIQSERIIIYNKIIDNLIESNIAYPCFCSKERIKKLKIDQLKKKNNFKYDRYCRNKNFSKEDLKYKKHVIRFKNPIDTYTCFNDWIHGKIKFNNNQLDDLIIRRENGFPTYNFCVVLDDLDMKITHIIRGSDHISNTPKQINILKSMKKKIPEYIHIPIILDENKSKLSKTNNSINLENLKKEGLLPESILHYLIEIGSLETNYKKENFIFLKEKMKLFSIKKINKSLIILNTKKLFWINKIYLSKLSDNKISKYLKSYIYDNNININNLSIPLNKLIHFFKERSVTLNDLLKNSEYLYKNIFIKYSSLKEFIESRSIETINNLIKEIEILKSWNIKNINLILNKIINNINNNKKIYKLIRILLSNKICTPKLSILIYLLGKNKSIKRLNIVNNFNIKY